MHIRVIPTIRKFAKILLGLIRLDQVHQVQHAKHIQLGVITLEQAWDFSQGC